MSGLTTISPWTLGINLSGAEYGDPFNGVMYWNYIYPTNAELDHYASEGAKIIRIPLSMERLQPTPDGALDNDQLHYLDMLVAHAAENGLQVILDPHNFGYAYGVEIGSTSASNISFGDFWSKIAAHYATSSNVVFGLMNEPHTQNATEWLASANLAINAIRQAGAMQEILVPGTWWDTAATWLQSGSAAALTKGVVDLAHNYAVEVHQYFDIDNSGTHGNVVSATIGVERLQAVTQWARDTGNRLFLGEFGVTTDMLSLRALSNTLTYMQANSDIWQGGTYWAAGPWMSNYMFSAETPTGTDTPQMTVLREFMSLPNPVVTLTTTTDPARIALDTVTPTAAAEPSATPAQIDNQLFTPNIQAIKTYRFFDTHSGTQFLTSDLAESNSLIATRLDLKYEGQGIEALSSTDAALTAIKVSRFFDTNSGNHFYTSSEIEKANLLEERSDLVLEQAAFFEYSKQQENNTPVYRFFENQTGNHFYTSSDNERSAISATRPDMVYEGIAFFAPKNGSAGS